MSFCHHAGEGRQVSRQGKISTMPGRGTKRISGKGICYRCYSLKKKVVTGFLLVISSPLYLLQLLQPKGIKVYMDFRFFV